MRADRKKGFGTGVLRWAARAALAAGIAGAFGPPPQVSAQQAQGSLPGFGIPVLVRLDPKGIVPVDVSIKPGTTVIWLNSTRGYVTIVFASGEELTSATQSPTRFFPAPDGTFTSNAFGPGAVASLSFLSPGQYRYFVSGVPGDFVRGEGVFGKIIVR